VSAAPGPGLIVTPPWPRRLLGVGAGAAVAAVAAAAGTSLPGASWNRRKHTLR
jgi:hypothetical protein